MRDEGCCTVCGAREDLRFAQVVGLERLVGRLASSVAAYLELRCGLCSLLRGRGGQRAQTRRALLGLG